MLEATNISENTQFAKFAKYNSTPKFFDLQYVLLYITRALSREHTSTMQHCILSTFFILDRTVLRHKVSQYTIHKAYSDQDPGGGMQLVHSAIPLKPKGDILILNIHSKIIFKNPHKFTSGFFKII